MNAPAAATLQNGRAPAFTLATALLGLGHQFAQGRSSLLDELRAAIWFVRRHSSARLRPATVVVDPTEGIGSGPLDPHPARLVVLEPSATGRSVSFRLDHFPAGKGVRLHEGVSRTPVVALHHDAASTNA